MCAHMLAAPAVSRQTSQRRCVQVAEAYDSAMSAMEGAGATLIPVNITDLLAMPGDNYAIGNFEEPREVRDEAAAPASLSSSSQCAHLGCSGQTVRLTRAFAGPAGCT